jgi:hypothetical protein
VRFGFATITWEWINFSWFASALTRTYDPFHFWLIAGTAALLLAPPPMAAGGISMPWCLVVLSLSPWVTMVGYELLGHRHNAAVIAALAQPQYARSDTA